MSDNNIFAELYNKLMGFFHQAEESENTKDVARNRLRVVLMQDRTNLTPQLLERMRGELVELLSKYLEMDKDALELNLDHDGEQMALALSIPVIRAKDEEEIEQAIAEEEAKKAEEILEEKANEETQANEENEKAVEETLDDDNNEIDTNKEEILESDNNEVDNKDTDIDTTDSVAKSKNKTTKTLPKKFPNKEICGDCKECEFADDIECEKKNLKSH